MKPTFSDCGKEISGKLHGTILSPNFPLTYPTDTLCTWKITVPEEYVIGLDFKVVEIERDYDMLFIYDTTTGDHIGRYAYTRQHFSKGCNKFNITNTQMPIRILHFHFFLKYQIICLFMCFLFCLFAFWCVFFCVLCVCVFKKKKLKTEFLCLNTLINKILFFFKQTDGSPEWLSAELDVK